MGNKPFDPYLYIFSTVHARKKESEEKPKPDPCEICGSERVVESKDTYGRYRRCRSCGAVKSLENL